MKNFILHWKTLLIFTTLIVFNLPITILTHKPTLTTNVLLPPLLLIPINKTPNLIKTLYLYLQHKTHKTLPIITFQNPSTNHIIVHDNIIHKPSLLEASITNTLIDKLAQKYHIADIDYLYFRKLLENFIEKQVTSPNDRYILITDIMGYRFQSDPQLKRTLNLHPDQFKSQRNKLKALWNLQLITAHRDYDHLSQLFADQISIILDLDHIINTSTADNLSFQGSTSQFFANNPRIFKAVYNFVNTLKNPEQKAMFLCIVFSIPKMSVEDISQVFNKNINYILNFVDLQVDRLINLHNLHDYKEFHLYKDLYINYYEVNNLTDENSSIEGSKTSPLLLCQII